MLQNDTPIPKHELAFLKSYLFSVFSANNKCEDNFNYTEWYLNAKYSGDEIVEIKKFFFKNNIKCDCGILNKL